MIRNITYKTRDTVFWNINTRDDLYQDLLPPDRENDGEYSLQGDGECF